MTRGGRRSGKPAATRRAPPPRLLASLEMIGIDRNGAEERFVVGVGQPRRRRTGEWACPTRSPDFRTARPICGNDSLQALCLGLSFIRCRLEDYLATGGRLFLAPKREEISKEDLAAWFSTIGLS